MRTSIVVIIVVVVLVDTATDTGIVITGDCAGRGSGATVGVMALAL